MVGCFRKSFKKTYVINQQPLVKNVTSSTSTRPITETPVGPRFTRLLDDLNTSYPVIKVYDVPAYEVVKPERPISTHSGDRKYQQTQTKYKEQTQVDTKNNKEKIKDSGSRPESLEKKPQKSDAQEVKPELRKPANGTIPKPAPNRPATRELPKIPTEASEPTKKQPEAPPPVENDSTIKSKKRKAPSVGETTGNKTAPPIPPTGRASVNRDTTFVAINEETLPEDSIYNVSTQPINVKYESVKETPNVVISEDLHNKAKPPEGAKAETEDIYEESLYTTSVSDRTSLKASDTTSQSIYGGSISERTSLKTVDRPSQITIASSESLYDSVGKEIRRDGVEPVRYEHNDYVELPVHIKTEEDEKLIRHAIEENEFLNKIIKKKERMDRIIDAMYDKSVHAKEIIIKQGDKGAHMYISAKGRYQILVKGKPFNEFSDVRVFGELAILYNAPRNATVKALTAGKIWVLDRQYYHQIIVGDNIQKYDEIMGFLKNSEKLKVAGDPVLQVVANLLKTEFFPGGKNIVKQGDTGHQFYIIRAGTVTITKEGEGVVGVYKKGDCFGELALLKEDKRQATVTADPPGVECLTLTREQFIQHFGEVESFRDAKGYDKRDSIQVPMTEYENIDIKELKIVTTLGVGGFGRVELVQHEKEENLVFALKYLKKYDVVSQHQQEHVINERAIQMACRSPFIVRMYRTFKDNKFVFFLMEPCLGGDVWGLLQKQRNKRFEESDARFICASVVEAFEYLHARGIIYRDLKPENLLIAANGYIKLTDFGFAKKMQERGKTFTFAGTPEYVAPEVVLNRGHDRAVDYWTLGCFIYEMLRGRTPFRTDDSSHMKTYTKILGGIDNVDFTSIPHKARHIIEKLCRPIPADRLGMQKTGIKDIKNHRWFLGFNWEKFEKCEISSPFKPKLKSPIDTSHIDKFKKDKDVPPDELSGWDQAF